MVLQSEKRTGNLVGLAMVALVTCKSCIIAGQNNHYLDLILNALTLMLNETHVNDLLCAALSKMARNEQLAGFYAQSWSKNANGDS